jgi:hypothetical protein
LAHDARLIADDCLFATVAQLVEQRFRKPQVSGSRPLGGFRNTRTYLEPDPSPALIVSVLFQSPTRPLRLLDNRATDVSSAQ